MQATLQPKRWTRCSKIAFHLSSVILSDIRIGTIEELLFLVQLVLEQRFAQRLADLALALDRLLPAGEAHDAHDLVDVGDDALDDHGRRHHDEVGHQYGLAPCRGYR